MADIQIKRGYEILHNNKVRFGIRLTNKSDTAISDVQVLLDYSHSLFELEGSEIEKLETIPPRVSRTAKFILKPLSCVHNEKIGATVIYKNSRWEKQNLEVRPKEIHCICPFLQEKQIGRSDFLKLLGSGYSVENSVHFENLSIGQLIEFLSYTYKNRLYKVDEFPTENGKVLYLAGDSPGEKAYYLLIVTVRETENILQVILNANSDKDFGIHGFLNEILDNLRHLVKSVNAATEITAIKNQQVINIRDSVVMNPNFSGKIETEVVNIESSVVPLNDIGLFNDEDKEKDTEEENHREQDEIEQIPYKKEETQSKITQTELFVKQETYEPHKQVKEENKYKATGQLDIEKLLEAKKADVIEQPVSPPPEKKGYPKISSHSSSKNFWSVLVVVLALVAAAYLGSYGDHATPAPAAPISLASFNTNTTSGHAPLDVQFTTLSENATLVRWDFGDGNTSIEQNPKHTYFTPGKYIVNLTASNGNITNSTLTTISVREESFAYILGDTVSVVDIATDNVVGTIKVGLPNEVVAVTPDGSKIYMAKLGNISTGYNTDISVIDTATNTITATVYVGSEPWGIAVTPDGTKVYLTTSNYFNPFPNTVYVIDTATDTVVTRVNVGSEALDVAVTPDGKKAYVTDWNNTVSVVDTSTNTITNTLNIDSATDQDLFRIKISPDGKKAYLINECGDTVSVIDTATNTITATVTAGRVLSGVITPDGTKVYVASYLDSNVSVIDTATNTVIATMSVGSHPQAVAVTPDGKKVYVVNRYSNNVSVIDTATNRVTTTVSVGEEPCDVQIAPDGKKVYVPNSNDGTCSVIDTATDTVTTTLPVGQNPIASIIR